MSQKSVLTMRVKYQKCSELGQTFGLAVKPLVRTHIPHQGVWVEALAPALDSRFLLKHTLSQ